MAGEISFNALDQRIPQEAINAFNLMGRYQQGQQQAFDMADKEQARQINALALQKATGGVEQDKQKRSLEMLKVLGPIAKSIVSAPDPEAAYQASMPIIHRLAPEAEGNLKPTYAESANDIQQFISVYDRLHPPEYQVDTTTGQYIPKDPSQGPAKPIPGFTLKVKAIWTDGGDKLIQMDEQGQPTGVTMPKGQLPSQAQPRQPTEFEQWQKNPEGFAQFKKAGKGDSEEGLGPLTPEAIDTAATRYLVDGTLPPMGMGKQAAAGRSAILNRAAELGKNTGMNPEEQRQFQIGTSVNKGNLSKLTQQKTMVGAFEKNFVKNADLALEMSKRVDRTGTPIVNKWVNVGKRAIAGDPDLAKFDISVKAAVNEYAKIISGSMGNTALAEGEIKKVESLLSAAQTPEQVEAVISFMKLETQNRMKGFEEQEAEIRGGMKLPTEKSSPQETKEPLVPVSAHQPTQNAKGWVLHTDAQGNKAYVSPDGKSFEEVK